MGTKLFKTESFEKELADAMEESLVFSQSKKESTSSDNIAKAVNFIHSAAEIFDDAGLHVEAEVLTRVLEKIANKLEEKEEQTLSLGALTHEEMKFYQSLPRHMKDDLEKHLKGKTYHIDPTDFIKEVKMLYKIRKAQEPEILEFESLLGGPPSFKDIDFDKKKV